MGAQRGCGSTICILTYGEHLAFYKRCLESVLVDFPPYASELRIGFNDAQASLAYTVGRLCPAGIAPARDRSPDGMERISFTTAKGTLVRLWNSRLNLYKEPMARRLFHELPFKTEYVIWFDDDSFAQVGWSQALAPLLEKRIDYIGQEWWAFYFPGQPEMIRTQNWYRGVPFDKKDGREGVRFMTGGFMAVRSERLREVNFPDVDYTWKGDRLKQYGGDTLLGEIAHQLGWSRAIHHKHIKVNVDMEGRHPAPRRGGTGKQFGSDVNVILK